jgi:DNA-directed RNA polymerase subunit M/transcription elongation factor TFIIS
VPEQQSPPSGANRPPPCRRCAGSLSFVTYQPRTWDHPAYDVFECIKCGMLEWVAEKIDRS